jgi:hypothetical protein
MIMIPKKPQPPETPEPPQVMPGITEEAIRLTGLDDCIVGTDARGYLIYDYGKLLHRFVKVDGMKEEEAIEWIDYNIIGISPQNFVIMFDDFDLEMFD